MTSVLHTQVTVAAKPIVDTQETTSVTQVHDDLAIVEANPPKKQKNQVTSSQTPTIDFIDCDTKEEVHSLVLVIEEVTKHLQTVIDLFHDNEMKDSIHIPRILESASILILQLHILSSHLSKLFQLWLLGKSHHLHYLNSITP